MGDVENPAAQGEQLFRVDLGEAIPGPIPPGAAVGQVVILLL